MCYYRTCAGCHAEIGHGRFLSCMGAVWHPECFRCHDCNQPISDYEVETLFPMYIGTFGLYILITKLLV